MNLAVFAYNFPHKKTQDILWKLLTDGIVPSLVLAQDPIELKIPKPTLRVKPRDTLLVHPKLICQRFGISYCVVDHNSEECQQHLIENHIETGIISGARILKDSIIRAVPVGIINLHPGLLPEVRGMDALQWAIYEGLPLGVTAHKIDGRIDAGFLIERQIIDEYPDDTFMDLSLRLYETEINMVSRAVIRLSSEPSGRFEPIQGGKLHRKMPPEIEAELPKLLKQRLSTR